MNITILSVQSITAQGAKGPYQTLEVAFKNNTFGKVESKKLMPFGAQKAVFDALANAQTGSVFEVTVVKNDKGYNDWTAVTQAPPGTINNAPAAASTKPTAGNVTQVKSTYETPEERAKKQVYIIRQSSITSAISSLTPGAKSGLESDKVLSVAQQYFDWVMQNPEANVLPDLFSVSNDEVM